VSSSADSNVRIWFEAAMAAVYACVKHPKQPRAMSASIAAVDEVVAAGAAIVAGPTAHAALVASVSSRAARCRLGKRIGGRD
jgi:hypothetical protein